MGRRRKGRELALQLLYELDVRGDHEEAATAPVGRGPTALDEDTRAFADSIVRGTRLHQPKIDELITRFAEHWELDRMAVVDRNILRAAIFELLWVPDVPPKVVINEALDIARKYSTVESTRFINGLLDRVRRELVP